MHNNNIETKTPFTFTLPEELSAKEPPELRGINRDHVKLLVINRTNGETSHSMFYHLSDFLKKGDLLVFNSSRTLPASLKTVNNKDQINLEIRLAEHLPDDSWLALLLDQETKSTDREVKAGLKMEFDLGLKAVIIKRDKRNPQLWKIKFSETGTELINLFYQIGNPIRYRYVSERFPLEYYQTVYAKDPGSSEMPSAGRAFTWKMLFDLKRKGIDTAYLSLHTGLSSYMDDEVDALHLASEEEYFIPEATADRIKNTKAGGGRIIAVGTTVVRALESAVNDIREVTSGHHYTTKRITEEHTLMIADGLITGLHEPRASHLDLLSAFLKPIQIKAAYEEAIAKKYLWHEFGDLNLIL
ncbi:MAG TPA: S-adenosylmethionine:tRNA ribosyltransferase-isomerase [Prolixibacteraceae bacterium]|jgi:S-adenosylmethionine:tRNA ribosyltransferase-isomerase|nr:S-adenosylmethionine:tRNA ribosyltransferase-isomerase [Prolixibacteraceae bacterium]